MDIKVDNRFKPYKDTVYSIIGAAMNTHSNLRWGLLEPIYNEAMTLELEDQGIQCQSEQLVPCYYKKHKLKKEYKIDIVVGDIIVELKSVSDIIPAHRAQLFNYLRLTRRPVGILINFGAPKLQGERFGFMEETNQCVLLDRNMEIIPQEVDWNVE